MTRKTGRILLLSTLTCMAGMVSGCRSSRSTESHEEYISGSPRERVEALGNYYAAHPVGSVSVPVSVEITAPARAKISGNLYMASSRYIYFSARFLGMEVGSIMITPDSIYGKIKPGKMYLAEPVSALTEMLPVTLNQIQELMMGRVVLPGYQSIDKNAAASCSYSIEQDYWTITPARLPRDFDMKYVMSTDANTMRGLIAEVKGKATASMVMADYAVTSLGDLPASVSIDAANGDKAYGLKIEYNYSRLRTDVVPDKSWSIPRGYTRVSPAQVIKVLSNL
ncbi:MAG: DUF4292 domain-containing protein [Duncaniella sp.]|nr:DUF4292 domain-containing protein [Duncaniella sp.]